MNQTKMTFVGGPIDGRTVDLEPGRRKHPYVRGVDGDRVSTSKGDAERRSDRPRYVKHNHLDQYGWNPGSFAMWMRTHAERPDRMGVAARHLASQRWTAPRRSCSVGMEVHHHVTFLPVGSDVREGIHDLVEAWAAEFTQWDQPTRMPPRDFVATRRRGGIWAELEQPVNG